MRQFAAARKSLYRKLKEHQAWRERHVRSGRCLGGNCDLCLEYRIRDSELRRVIERFGGRPWKN